MSLVGIISGFLILSCPVDCDTRTCYEIKKGCNEAVTLINNRVTNEDFSCHIVNPKAKCKHGECTLYNCFNGEREEALDRFKEDYLGISDTQKDIQLDMEDDLESNW